EEVAEAIRPGGLGKQKAGRIRAFLRWLKESRGELSLEFLRKKEPEEALKLLTPHKGVGVKTVYVMLMGAAGKDVFPVDVHIHRIARRLGLIGPRTTPEKAHWELAPLVPKGKAYSLHLNLLAFGRTICTARNPRCGVCPFRSICLYYKELKAYPGPRATRGSALISRPSR
ncbi:MAG: endonuclease III domain-containing protein, partial [Nitrospinota bacterium]